MRSLSIAALLVASVLVGCTREDNTGSRGYDPGPSGVDFLLFPNSHASLGVGDYSVLFVNAVPPVDPTPYTLTVTTTDGTVHTFSGNLSTTGTTTTHQFENNRPGGATIALNTNGVLALMVLRVGTTTANLAVSSAVANPSIELPRYEIDSVTYAQAYYAAIDPDSDRETLAEYKAENGFGATCAPNGTTEFEVRFRDVLDLGYGRHMCARGNASAAGNVAVWVENFQVTAIPGVKYGPLNLEAVVNDDRRWHVGTNAIEYAPANPTLPFNATTNPRIVKFYTFNPDGTRRLVVDLDGRGAKAMPVPCISCHGGHALPLTANGLFPAIRTAPRGDTLARMQPLNVDTLDFSPDFPWRRVDQEASLKSINQLVLCTYPFTGFLAGDTTQGPCRPTFANLEWGGTAASMIKSWYGGDTLPNDAFSDTFVPSAWTDAGSGVAGSQNLYRTVVAPNCRVCHLLRGNLNENGVDFTTYTKFAGTNPTTGYNDRIKHHVFDKGNMPLALLKFDTFWESDAPATLASFITGAMDGGSVLQPTRPVAKPGPNRTIVTNVATTLSAAESVNATSYNWRVTSGNAANTVLTNPNSVRPTFTATANGVYTLELVVGNGSTSSEPATLTIGAVASLVDGAGLVTVADPAAIRFSHIRTILQDNAVNYFCTSCHTNADPGGPPVYYTDYDRDGDGDIDAADLHQFYLDIRARINFTDIESSRILFRPSGHHHPGGLITNFNDTATPGSAGRGAYDIFLNWILNGAPE